MAIDTKSLTPIITESRALQTKDAVSPESLGYILQRMVDLHSTAVTSETVNSIQKLLNGFKAALLYPWGGDKQMPFKIIEHIDKDETLATCQIFVADRY